MLIFFELIFLVVGIWVLISGKISPAINRFLFGKNAIKLTVNQSRLIGLLLITPLPIAFFVGIIVGLFLGQDYLIYATIVEFLYLLFIIVFLNRIAKKWQKNLSSTQEASSSEDPIIDVEILDDNNHQK